MLPMKSAMASTGSSHSGCAITSAPSCLLFTASTCRAVAKRVFPRLVDVEMVVRVLEHRDAQPDPGHSRQQFFQQGRLAHLPGPGQHEHRDLGMIDREVRDELEARHVQETAHVLVQRSRSIVDKVCSGSLAIVGVTYRLEDGRVELRRSIGNIGEDSFPPTQFPTRDQF